MPMMHWHDHYTRHFIVTTDSDDLSGVSDGDVIDREEIFEEVFESFESSLRQVKMWLVTYMYMYYVSVCMHVCISMAYVCIDRLGQKIRGNSEQKAEVEGQKRKLWCLLKATANLQTVLWLRRRRRRRKRLERRRRRGRPNWAKVQTSEAPKGLSFYLQLEAELGQNLSELAIS